MDTSYFVLYITTITYLKKLRQYIRLFHQVNTCISIDEAVWWARNMIVIQYKDVVYVETRFMLLFLQALVL